MPTSNSYRPSQDELIALVNNNPEYRSAILLSRHLKIGRDTARRYLESTGIKPMTKSEAALIRHTLIRHSDDKEQYVKVVELLATTTQTLYNIGKGIGIGENAVKRIQDRSIKDGELDPKYRRALTRTNVLQATYEKILELLKTTTLDNTHVGEEMRVSWNIVVAVQNKAIERGELEPKYRRLNGVVQWQYDKTLEFLKNTAFTHKWIAEEVGLSDSTVRSIQKRAISEGLLDPAKRKLIKDAPTFRELIETDEESLQMVEAAEQLAHYGI